ncbi:MAG TPA: hypothetical protein VG518_09680, partial [Solirubrobacterales bacterium]|nr:hypothetical protein [Solirubrobacterales bacterium]
KPLHICPECESAMVYPVEWEVVGGGDRWRCRRRCPECEWQHDGVHHEDDVHAYEEVLHLGTEMLGCALKEWELRCMQEMGPAFSHGLATDLISAEDFR